ncbi:Retrovirus-related Pol polyprotein from transposon TNT 1-94 [Cucumis melo var. makuwa]|uniref:Retrovirus-related Pol polyprotein from transposon TNT 1-94 n=1 Tax=Cucumis melo var. makuwa TaxID=1194695 RepID=A0A5D3DIY9_CUCMM|nr:Retrovirus-related Pol polyprotein from transposon TNT 1-94 [Cucumis melo var. makuwa]
MGGILERKLGLLLFSRLRSKILNLHKIKGNIDTEVISDGRGSDDGNEVSAKVTKNGTREDCLENISKYDPSLDLPIAQRKGTKSCTKHSTTNYVSYKNLSPHFRAFTASLDSTTIPKNIHFAFECPEWKTVVMEEIRFKQIPYKEHMETVNRIMRFDWAESINDRKSTSGYCTSVWDNLITWRSKKQEVVVRSSAEDEYKVMSSGICEEIWLQKVLSDLRQDYEVPMKLFCNNKATISIANNPVQHDRTKHLEI